MFQTPTLEAGLGLATSRTNINLTQVALKTIIRFSTEVPWRGGEVAEAHNTPNVLIGPIYPSSSLKTLFAGQLLLLQYLFSLNMSPFPWLLALEINSLLPELIISPFVCKSILPFLPFNSSLLESPFQWETALNIRSAQDPGGEQRKLRLFSLHTSEEKTQWIPVMWYFCHCPICFARTILMQINRRSTASRSPYQDVLLYILLSLMYSVL